MKIQFYVLSSPGKCPDDKIGTVIFYVAKHFQTFDSPCTKGTLFSGQQRITVRKPDHIRTKKSIPRPHPPPPPKLCLKIITCNHKNVIWPYSWRTWARQRPRSWPPQSPPSWRSCPALCRCTCTHGGQTFSGYSRQNGSVLRTVLLSKASRFPDPGPCVVATKNLTRHGTDIP